MGFSNASRIIPYNDEMSHLDILIPFALPPPEMAPDLVRALKMPALASLLSQAKHTTTPTLDEFSSSLPHEHWLAEQFGIANRQQSHGSPPVSVASMQALGLTPDAGVWFMLQPVHIHVARDHLVLTDLRQLQLTEPESRALFDVAAPFFQEVGKPLVYGTAHSWFVRADDWAALSTSTPDATCGHNIDIWMPKGSTAIQWRKLQNEIQMAWHGHPLNDAREQIGLKPVNSIWLWGGTPTAMPVTPPRYQQLFNPQDWMRALTPGASTQHAQCNADELRRAAPTNGLLTLDALLEPGLASDWAEWIDRMHQCERDWFEPMLAAVKDGAIERLSLILTNSTSVATFILSRRALRKFWVKPALSRLLP